MSMGNLQFFIQIPWNSASSKTKSRTRSSGKRRAEHEPHGSVFGLHHDLGLHFLARRQGQARGVGGRNRGGAEDRDHGRGEGKRRVAQETHRWAS